MSDDIGYGVPVDEATGRAHDRLVGAVYKARCGPMNYAVMVILGPRHPCRDITHVKGARVWVLDTVPREIKPDGALIAIPITEPPA